MTARQLLSLAWRESRFGRRRLFLFLSAISLGVAALVAVEGFATNMQREVRDQARAMLGADVSLSSRQPFAARTEALVDSLRAERVAVARVTSFASMALNEASGATRLVQVRAPDPGFPFYGEIETEPAGAWRALHEGRNVVVDPALLFALEAGVGDSIAIGAIRFRIAAVLQKLPGDVEIASSFAPRVFFARRHLPETGLLGFGARVDYEAFLRLPDPVAAESLVDGHRELFRADRVRARTLEDQQERMEEALGRLSSFLGLIGVFALLLGGIGVASAMGAYVARKADTVAVFRCLGASARQVLGIYLLQATMMGFVGAMLGVILGGAVQWILPQLLAGLLPVDVQVRPEPTALVTGVLVGVLTAVIFALLPLLRIREVSPLRALRRRVEPLQSRTTDRLRLFTGAAVAISALLLVYLQANDLGVTLAIVVGIATCLVLLRLAAAGLTRLVGRSRAGGLPYAMRQGLANLYRPGNQTSTVLVALGFGVFLIGTLLLTQTSLLDPLAVDHTTRGNLLLFDVQDDQHAGVEEALTTRQLPIVERAAIIPMRIAAVEGEPVVLPPPPPDGDDAAMEEDTADQRPGGWAVRREYRSTFRDSIASTEELLEGRWWAADQPSAGPPYELSLDEEIARELGVRLGARIDWDVQGMIVPTRVTSIRRVDWARLEPNFFAVFEPAALVNAPKSWLILARADSAAERALVQRDIVSRYPNVSAIDLTLVQRALDDLIGRISLVIRFLAAFSVVTGLVVLLGAIAAGRLERIRESVLLKTLGATRRQITTILLAEYGLLGLLSGLAGVSLALLAGWGIAEWIFEVPLVIDSLALLGLVIAIAVVSAVVGLAASSEVFRSTPMEAIRSE